MIITSSSTVFGFKRDHVDLLSNSLLLAGISFHHFLKQSTPYFILELILNIIKPLQAIDIQSKTITLETQT